MGTTVTLYHATAGTITLPLPAHQQTIETEPNQTVHHAAGGSVQVYRHGPVRYRITRTFESLTETQSKNIADFFVSVGRSGGSIEYRYTPAATGVAKAVPCRIIEAPQETKVMTGIRDVTLVFEQTTHPDRDSEP